MKRSYHRRWALSRYLCLLCMLVSFDCTVWVPVTVRISQFYISKAHTGSVSTHFSLYFKTFSSLVCTERAWTNSKSRLCEKEKKKRNHGPVDFVS
ncbi:hypothetical protein B9Z19DRAFT_1093214 [Tuber borchii]|uniref:Uncharacterized protein n=1 Tax=Tuber borchii TaxID=42251 RepID=A0A2T6ZFK8_TUBBO|nr:hypothetical protein B9Z19DRAFT_1093214 [Tuber borchii]